MRRGLVSWGAVAVALVCALGVGAAASDDPGEVLATIELPPEGPEWVRVDIPPAIAGRPFEVRDTTGASIPFFRVTRRLGAGAAVPQEVAREEAADGRTVVEIQLPSPAEAPHRLVLPGAFPPIRVEVGDPLREYRPLVEVDRLDDGEEPTLELPPFVGKHLRVTAGGLGVTRLRWDDAPEEGRLALEPAIVGRRLLSRAQEILVDLRVAWPFGLEVDLALNAAATDEPLVLHGPGPDAPPSAWRPLAFTRAASDAGVRGVARPRDNQAGRWLRVISRSDSPDAVEIESVSASVLPVRLFVRRAGTSGPISLRTVKRPAGLDVLTASWDAGSPATISRVPFPDALGYGLRPPPLDAGRSGRPFPGAEVLASALFAALTIWAFLLRRDG